MTATKEFTANNTNGSVDIEFTFDASLLAGEDVVAFESLVKDSIEVAVHADIEDEGQTVHFVDIGTTAADAADGDKLVTGSEVIIADEVAFEGLTPGGSYTLEATLMDAETGEPLKSGEGLLATDVAATVEFTPEAAEGTQTVELSFDSSGLGGHRLVVFEKLLDAEGTVLAVHEDIEDRGPVRHGRRDRHHARRRRRRRPHGRERDGHRRGYRRVQGARRRRNLYCPRHHHGQGDWHAP